MSRNQAVLRWSKLLLTIRLLGARAPLVAFLIAHPRTTLAQAASKTSPAESAAPPAPAAIPSDGSTVLPSTEQAGPSSGDSSVTTTVPVAVVPLTASTRRITSWEQIESSVRDHAPAIQEAQGHFLEVVGVARQKLGLFLPQVDATLSGTRQLLLNDETNNGVHLGPIPNPAFTWQATSTLRVPIFVPRGWYDYATAREVVHGAELQTQDARRRAMAAAVDGVLAVLTTQQLYSVGVSTLKSATATAELTERGRQSGFVNVPDVVRARQEVSAVELANVKLEEDVLLANEALGAALGLTVPATLAEQITPELVLQNLRTACRALPSVEERADVKSAEVTMQAAARDVKSSYLGYLPTVDALTALTYNSDISINVPEKVSLSTNGLHTTWVVGAVLTLPLYDGGVRYGQHAESAGRLLVAQANLSRVKQDAARDVQQAAFAVEIARQRFEAARLNHELAVEAARLMKLSFANGSSTTFDLLETQRRVWLAEHDLILSQAGLTGAEAGKLLAVARCRL